MGAGNAGVPMCSVNIRVADPVPTFSVGSENQNFENRIRIRILLALAKIQSKHLKICKSLIFLKMLSLCIQLYIARVESGSGEKFQDPDPSGS